MFLSALCFEFGHALPSRTDDQRMTVDARMRGRVGVMKGSRSGYNIWSQAKDLQCREGTLERRKDQGRGSVLPLESYLRRGGSGDVRSMAWAWLTFTVCHAVRPVEGKGKAPWDQSRPADAETQTLRFPLRFSVKRNRLLGHQTTTGPANTGAFPNFSSPPVFPFRSR